VSHRFPGRSTGGPGKRRQGTGCGAAGKYQRGISPLNQEKARETSLPPGQRAVAAVSPSTSRTAATILSSSGST
jgi:hypothetical protein